ncbi:glycylpeptide N-tetradecanoyltransferase [Colletotrichum spaethianum]|uniref:Glycylpeptide N-tetradecanoyltransferase n=1 Tax=Colletotrichum spaethianum TaxID=700344 RepID=A0AA37L4D0_9PEZI|nr:glycylpeptide N-tetradecanoyltransferase [Colletotrichum spaethianum]GKT41521.1 glycylpeptide N-tetradecanoyltransferase [Colletotrichum spaethianum]
MPAEESKPLDPAVKEANDALAEATDKGKGKEPEVESEDEDGEDAPEETAPGASAASAKKKKKKSKRKKIKEALTGKPSDPEQIVKDAIGGLTPQQLTELLALNPALANELGVGSSSNKSAEETAAAMQKLNLQDIMTGLASAGKNAKDMASYKFWATQPVPKFGEALMAPGWRKEWHVGVRASQSRKLVAFISAIPVNLRVRKNVVTCSELPDATSTKGLRELQEKDIDAACELLTKYLKRFDMAPEFSKDEFRHWFLHDKNAPGEQVIWTYVIETNGKITDMFSFYCLESTVINSSKHQVVRAAYLWYYASDVAFATPFSKEALKTRLNSLINDALIMGKKYKFDVFNGLSLLDNGLFLEQQKFGPGDGQLHYYLFNYRAAPIAGGVDRRNKLDEENLSGIGLVML